MAFLAVDTGSELGGVAVVEGDHLLAESAFRTAGRHAERLAPVISDVLRSAGIKGGELEGVGVAVGPGSFTGLRIGVTTAKTLAWAWKRPLVPVHSLDALAVQAASGLGRLGQDSTVATAPADTPETGSEPAWVIPMIDARRSGVYAAVYRIGGTVDAGGTRDGGARDGGDGAEGAPDSVRSAPWGRSGEPTTYGSLPAPLSLWSAPAVVPLVRLVDLLPDGAGRVMLVGDGALKGSEALSSAADERLVRPLASASDLRALSVAELGRMRLARGESAAPATVVPVYIRPAATDFNESEAGSVGSRGR